LSIPVASVNFLGIWISELKHLPPFLHGVGLYTQDNNLAADGQYDWYVATIDLRTGEEKWRVRTGAGGRFNDVALIAQMESLYKLLLEALLL
jgi:cation diffusion facilitator CzcD-associated flavoprotein CzcO